MPYSFLKVNNDQVNQQTKEQSDLLFHLYRVSMSLWN